MSYLVLHPELVLKYKPKRRPFISAPMVFPVNQFSFEELPVNIQAMIFECCLVKQTSIHAISRMDPYGQVRINEKASDGLPRLFHWGTDHCAMGNSQDPNKVLALLLVSKSFHHMGASCFYSKNTFAFSSLGEFGRFFHGIGPVRRQRVKRVSLTWIGARMPAKYSDSIRTKPLHVFPKLIGLTHIDIYLDESSLGRERRKYEGKRVKQVLRVATDVQLNNRPKRALRTIQGMDYVYALRGIKEANIFDYGPEGQVNEPVLDTHFVDDLRAQIYQSKRRGDRVEAQWENLDPYFKNWKAPAEVLHVTEHFFIKDPTSPLERAQEIESQHEKLVIDLTNEPSVEVAGNSNDIECNSIPGGIRSNRRVINLKRAPLASRKIVDLTKGGEDEVFLPSIEHDIDHFSSAGSKPFNKTVKLENGGSDNHSPKTGEIWPTTSEAHDLQASDAKTRVRLLERIIQPTRRGNKRLRLQGSAPI